MKIYDKITPEGTKDILFDSCILRQRAQAAVEVVFKKRGFRPVRTPIFEFYDVFGANRYFPQESMYKLSDAKGRLLVLRPDSTIPIARLAATKLQNEHYPIRLCYHQSVYRNHPDLQGHSDEQSQSGGEIIGAAGTKADLEVLLTAGECMRQCGATPFTLELGHIGIFHYFIKELAATPGEKEEIRQLIEAKNYTALQDLLSRLSPQKTAKALARLPRLFGGGEVFATAKGLSDNPDYQRTLEELEGLYNKLTAAVPAQKIQVDLGLVNQADYYTGIVFRSYLSGMGEPVLTGGRYDRLFDDFGLKKPAVGFAMNIDAVADFLGKSTPVAEEGPEVLVYWEDDYFSQGLVHIRELEKQGVRCETSLQSTLKQAKDYAANRKIPAVHLVGEKIQTILITEKGEEKQ